jgi:lipopolysaccharide heptosyltransferase II
LVAEESGFGKGYDFPPSAVERAAVRAREGVKRIGKAILRAIMGLVGGIAALPHLLAYRPKLSPVTFHPRRIAIIRIDLLGDVVMMLPMIHALRRAYPGSEIDLVVTPANVALLLDQPGIDHIRVCDPERWMGSITTRESRTKIRASLRELRAAHYDLAISVCGEWASVVARLCGARRRVGFAGEAYPGFLTDAVPGRRFTLGLHEVEHCLKLAERAGATIASSSSPERLPRLHVDPLAQVRVRALLSKHGIPRERPIVALHAGSGNGQAKRWPMPYWARLADGVLAEDDATVVLIGAPNDTPLAQGVIQRMRHPAGAIDLTGQTTLPELAALLAACAVVVSGDSGPMHVAEAVGARLVVLHGPTNPKESGPYNLDPTCTTIIKRDLPCQPCYDSRATAECRFGNPLCMKGITPAEVLTATRAHLRAACGTMVQGNYEERDTKVNEAGEVTRRA